MSNKQKFMEKFQALEPQQMREVYERLQKEPDTPLGILMWMGRTYAEKVQGKTRKRILK